MNRSVAVVFTAMLLVVVGRVVGKNYTVGKGLCSPASWSSDSCDYTTWALQNDFYPGDSLVFNFDDPTQSNVAEVSQDDYDGCIGGAISANPTYVYAKPPVIIHLSKPGTFYFASTVGLFGCIYSHMAVIVNSTTGTPTSSTADPTPAGPTTGGDVATPTTDSSTPTPTESSASNSTASSPHGSSTHKSIVGPLVGSIGSVIVVVKIAMIAYWTHRRKQQRLNAQVVVVPTKHELPPVVYHSYHPNTGAGAGAGSGSVHHNQVEVDVHVQGHDNPSFGNLVSNYN